jgi:hypothetical protein
MRRALLVLMVLSLSTVVACGAGRRTRGGGGGGGDGGGDGGDGSGPVHENGEGEGEVGLEGEGEGGQEGEGEGGQEGEGEVGQEGEGEEGEGEVPADCVDEDFDEHYAISRDCPQGNDCNDSDPRTSPGIEEDCTNAFDNDCDGDFPGTDSDCDRNCIDLDGDGFGRGPDCRGIDCDDDDVQTFEGAREICGDGRDNNCDGEVDDRDQCGGGGHGMRCAQTWICFIDCEEDGRCAEACENGASEEALESLSAYTECYAEECGQDAEPNCGLLSCGREWRDCILDNDEQLECHIFYSCLVSCPQEDEECQGTCLEAVSERGRRQFDDVQQCLAARCPDLVGEAFQQCAEDNCQRELDACFPGP